MTSSHSSCRCRPASASLPQCAILPAQSIIPRLPSHRHATSTSDNGGRTPNRYTTSAQIGAFIATTENHQSKMTYVFIDGFARRELSLDTTRRQVYRRRMLYVNVFQGRLTSPTKRLRKSTLTSSIMFSKKWCQQFIQQHSTPRGIQNISYSIPGVGYC